MTSLVIGSPLTNLFARVEAPRTHQCSVFSEKLPVAVHLGLFELPLISGVAVLVKR